MGCWPTESDAAAISQPSNPKPQVGEPSPKCLVHVQHRVKVLEVHRCGGDNAIEHYKAAVTRMPGCSRGIMHDLRLHGLRICLPGLEHSVVTGVTAAMPPTAASDLTSLCMSAGAVAGWPLLANPAC
jgi:hypothetical protein